MSLKPKTAPLLPNLQLYVKSVLSLLEKQDGDYSSQILCLLEEAQDVLIAAPKDLEDPKMNMTTLLFVEAVCAIIVLSQQVELDWAEPCKALMLKLEEHINAYLSLHQEKA